MNRCLLVMLGGAAGSLLRYVVGSLVGSRWPGRFPLGTFTVNVTGCFLIGIIMTILTERGFHQNWRFLLVVGFLGGFTTFSSFEYETYVSGTSSEYMIGGLYVLASVLAGLMAVWLGVAVVRK